MPAQIHWISKGSLQPVPPEGGSAPVDERDLLHRQGFVKIVEDENGITVRWAMFSSNWASLYFAMEWIYTFKGPFFLNYYSAGWFQEKFLTVDVAADRMSQLIAKSDVHLSRTIYIHDADASRTDVPGILKTALNQNKAGEESSIDCLLDPYSGKYRVHRVGPKSTIAQVYGLSPVSYPCLTGHSYDQAVSRVYPEVIQTGKAHYDHIYAAMSSPVGDIVWVPYQRVVLPLKCSRNTRGVRIVTELTKVDISPL